MVFTGSRYYVTWQYRPTVTSWEVDMAAIEPDGTVSLPWQVIVPSRSAIPWIVWNDELKNLGLIWSRNPAVGVDIFEGANVAADGTLSGTTETVSLPTGANRDGRLGARPGGFAFGCRSPVTTSQGDLYVTPRDGAMDPVSAPVPLTQGEDNSRTGHPVWPGRGCGGPVGQFASCWTLCE